jgi:hypothetical protein
VRRRHTARRNDFRAILVSTLVSGAQIGELNPMRLNSIYLEDEYRTCAAEAIKLASKQADRTYKGRLLRIAEAWLDLADRAAKNVKKRRVTRAAVEHPLVQQVLGPDQARLE